jgi:hypothetical protein
VGMWAQNNMKPNNLVQGASDIHRALGSLAPGVADVWREGRGLS